MSKFKYDQLLLVDSSMLAHRCWHGMPDLTNSKGESTGLEFGFLRSLESIQRKYPSHQVVLCWDCRGANAEKRKVFSGYKAERMKKALSSGQNKLYPRLDYLRENVLSALYPSASAMLQEADDVMFSLSRECNSSLIYTNDKDLLQAVDDRTVVLRSHGYKMWEWDFQKVWETYFVKPEHLPLYRAIIGDKSDELPGTSALGLRRTAEFVREAYRRDLHPLTAINQVVNERRLTDRARLKWNDHVSSGQLEVNFKLMQLQVRPCVYTPVDGSMDKVKENLLKWEIRTLRLSKRLAIKTTEEEF